MLIQFSARNFRSIKEKVTFSMEASSYNKELTDEGNIRFLNERLMLLPAAAIYGANSSGKSNLLSAMWEMRNVVLSSIKMNSSEDLPTDPFALDEAYSKGSTEFEAKFLLNKRTYRYGFIYDSKEIKEEWLFETAKIKEQVLFSRKGDTFSISKKFQEGEGKEQMTPSNRLFLSLVSQLNGGISKQIIGWFQHFNSINAQRNDNFRDYSIKQLLENSQKSLASKKFLKQMDLGFTDLKPGEQPLNESMFPPGMPASLKESILKNHANEKMRYLESVHMVHQKDGSFKPELFSSENMESDGTMKMFDLSGPIIDTLVNGYTLVVDELDAQLHPLLTRRIINIFNSKKGNPFNAQLIFATHDTNLLKIEILRRDQIWFVEKKKNDESSELKHLSEIMVKRKNSIEESKVRKDQIFEEDYLGNLYGALPEMKQDFDLIESMKNLP